MYSLPKIMWIKNNLKDSFKKAKYIFLMQDYIVYKLSGVRQIDYSLAARTIAFDISNKCWSDEILDYCEIDKSMLSVPVPSGSIAGEILSDVAKELSLNPKTKIVSGCHDQIAAMTGVNVFTSDDVMDGTGTVECVPVIMDKVPKDYELFKAGYSFAPHINGKYACYALSYAGGATLKWFKQNIDNRPYDELNRDMPDCPTDLLIMPHFAGAATPYMDINSKAAVVGLTFEHTKGHIYKALMEGTAYEIGVNLKVLKKHGLCPKMLIATGGGAKSWQWLQIKADVLGIPVALSDAEEAGTAGTAYLAGAACGMYDKDFRVSNIVKVFYPDQENHKYYKTMADKYDKIYYLAKQVTE